MTLIGIAIAVFVVLVSAQVFHDWPIAALGSPDQKPAVSQNKALPTADGARASRSATTVVPAKANGNGGAAAAAPRHAARHRAAGHQVGGATSTSTTAEAAPVAGEGGGSSSGGKAGSHSKQAASSPPPSSQGTSNSGSGSSGGNGGGPGASGSTGQTGSKSSPGSGPTGGDVTTTVTEAAGTATQSPAEAVNGAVGTVDQEALGGTLESTGVAPVVEGVVNGAAGPDTVVGKTVEGVGETVNGLLGGGGN